MHTKHTVRYICEEFSSGRKYFYKQELLTMGSWKNPESLYWSRPRPITEKTFKKQKKAGFRVEHRLMKNKPADIVFLSRKNDTEGRDPTNVRHKKNRRTNGCRSARARLLLR